MQGAVLYGPRDVRFEERDAPTIIKPTDAIIRISATCVCGSDLWPYRGISAIDRADADGARVLRHRRGGRQRGHARSSPASSSSARSSPPTTPVPTARPATRSSCQHREFVGGAQAPVLRVPLADGTLVARPDVPSDDLIPSLLALPTCWAPAGSPPTRPT